MKSIAKLLIVLLVLTGALYAKGMFQSVPEKDATILQTGAEKMYCPACGMHLPKFWKTSHAVELKDGTHRQYCSIHCVVEEFEMTVLRGKRDTVKKIMVVDVTSGKYTDVKDATYVVGSKKPGTMTVQSKYAFKDPKAAEKFAKEFGGEVTNFDGAYKVAMDGFARDTGMVLAKRTTKMYKMGKKLYDTKCDKSKLDTFHMHNMASLKAKIRDSKVCGADLNDAQYQGVALYIWDVKQKNFEKLYGANEEINKNAEMFKKKMMKK